MGIKDLMNSFLRGMLNRKIIRKVRHFRRLWIRLDAIEKNEAKFLREKYPGINFRQIKTPLNRHEFSVHSQNGEDGILAYLFSKIGVKNGNFIEFGSGGERGCNSANLAINFGWKGLFIEAIKNNILDGREFYSSFPKIKKGDVKFSHNWITKENINKIIKGEGFRGEIDLLSIDIDGNDYHIFEAINVIKPRVVIIEYNALFGKEQSLTINYNPLLAHYDWYYGASLMAITKLAKNKGYVLVGCESRGSNAFYVRKDLAKGKIKEISVKEAFYPKPNKKPKSSKAIRKIKKHLKEV